MVRYMHDAWHENANIMPVSVSSFPTVPGFFAKPGQNLVIGLTDLFGPHTVNQMTLGYTRIGITTYIFPSADRPASLSIPTLFGDNIYNAPPTISLSGFGSIGAAGGNTNMYNDYNYRDDLTRQIGHHTLKFGTNIFRFQSFQTYPNSNQQGTLTFNGSATGNALADMLLGDVYEYTEKSIVPHMYLFSTTYEMYAQDDWKVRPNLTINLGLRYSMLFGTPEGREKYNNASDFVPSLYSAAAAPTVTSNGRLVAGTGNALNGIITPTNQKGLGLPLSMDTTDYDNWGPRAGFAWSVGGSRKTVVRGGYGIFYFWDNSNAESLSGNPPFAQSAAIFNTNISNPAQGTTALFPPNLSVNDPYREYPMVKQWSFTLERELPSRHCSLDRLHRKQRRA